MKSLPDLRFHNLHDSLKYHLQSGIRAGRDDKSNNQSFPDELHTKSANSPLTNANKGFFNRNVYDVCTPSMNVKGKNTRWSTFSTL